MSLKSEIDLQRLPKHIAIVMDGNGRWAKQQDKPRSYGHQYGVESVRTVLKAAANIGVEYLTLYTFSNENWNRPDDEVTALMGLLVHAIKHERDELNANNIRMKVIGDVDRLEPGVQKELFDCIETLSGNTGLTLVLALSYSSRWEIATAVKRIASDVQSGIVELESINEEVFDTYVSNQRIPDPDLMIRTGGEIRISNFLLWQIAYSELYFTEEYWPDFGEESLFRAILFYQSRERRFGKISEQISNDHTV